MTKHEFENLKTGDLFKLKHEVTLYIFMSVRYYIDSISPEEASYYVIRHFDLSKSRMRYLKLYEPWKYFVKI